MLPVPGLTGVGHGMFADVAGNKVTGPMCQLNASVLGADADRSGANV